MEIWSVEAGQLDKKKLFLLRWIFGLSSTFKLNLKPGSAVQVAKHAT